MIQNSSLPKEIITDLIHEICTSNIDDRTPFPSFQNKTSTNILLEMISEDGFI